MAKKKQKKNQNKSGFKYPIEIKGIIFIVIAIIGFLGFKANCTLLPPVSTPISRNTAMEAFRKI